MTQKYNDETSLFSSEESDSEAIEIKRRERKRSSLGFKLPIRSYLNLDEMSGQAPAPGPENLQRRNTAKPNPSTDQKGQSSSGPSDAQTPQSPPPKVAGTSLGFAGATQVSGLVFTRKNTEGKMVNFDIFSDVNKGVDAAALEKIIQVLAANPSLTKFGEFIDGILYQGFDREFYIKHALGIVSVSVFCRFAILGAIRGSNFEKIKESSLDMPNDLARLVSDNTVIKKAKKRTDLTILRFTASIPHWVAYWMHAHAVPKKIDSQDCPAYLQFPGAASVPMSSALRKQHVEFCIAFSSLLPGGSFNANIYMTAYQNMVPIGAIPSDFLSKLGVSSASEARSMTVKELTDMTSKQVAKTT